MKDINLLPWRENQNKMQIHKYVTIYCTTLLCVIIVTVFVSTILTDQIQLYEKNNALLEEEIKKTNTVTKQIDEIKASRDYLIKMIKIIERLQKTRYLPARIFDEIAKAVPQDMYLTKIELADNKVYIEGIVCDNNIVYDFMKNLEFSALFAKTELVEIKVTDDKKELDKQLFKIKLECINP